MGVIHINKKRARLVLVLVQAQATGNRGGWKQSVGGATNRLWHCECECDGHVYICTGAIDSLGRD